MDKIIYVPERKSRMEIGEVYFWTATINSWYHLLAKNRFKEIIIGSLRTLSERGLIDVFSFVIMPNHIHLIWHTNGLNKKETAQGSFLKFTAHAFKRLLKDNKEALSKYAVNAHNKEYEFWQRDPLAIHLYSRHVMMQKLNYIHLNPLAADWNLVNHPCDYYYSSARFYEMGVRDFDFLKDIREVF